MQNFKPVRSFPSCVRHSLKLKSVYATSSFFQRFYGSNKNLFQSPFFQADDYCTDHDNVMGKSHSLEQ